MCLFRSMLPIICKTNMFLWPAIKYSGCHATEAVIVEHKCEVCVILRESSCCPQRQKHSHPWIDQYIASSQGTVHTRQALDLWTTYPAHFFNTSIIFKIWDSILLSFPVWSWICDPPFQSPDCHLCQQAKQSIFVNACPEVLQAEANGPSRVPSVI